MRLTQYRYATFKASHVTDMFKQPVPEDSYLASDAETDAIKQALMMGFRWVRTDGDIAVFERIENLSPIELLDSSHATRKCIQSIINPLHYAKR